MPALSGYLGHVSPEGTYWYYSDSLVIPGQVTNRQASAFPGKPKSRAELLFGSKPFRVRNLFINNGLISHFPPPRSAPPTNILYLMAYGNSSLSGIVRLINSRDRP